jgi:hypothetical protein
VTEALAAPEAAPAPLWGTWAGTLSGLWVGTVAAYAPSTGVAEPLALAEDGRTKVVEMSQCCVEARDGGGGPAGGGDRLLRRTARAGSQAQLAAEMAAAGAGRFDAAGGAEWEEEALSPGQGGLLLFDGGTYSAGPEVLGVRAAELEAAAALRHAHAVRTEQLEAGGSLLGHEGPTASASGSGSEEEDGGSDGEYGDEGEEYYEEEEGASTADPGNRRAAVIEACLQWGGEQRVRVRLTLSSSGGGPAAEGGGELDVDLLRVVVCREAWEGLPGQYTAAAQPEAERAAQAASGGRRLEPADLAGFWNEFQVSGATVEDVDMATGEPARIPVYASREVQRLVRRPEEAGGGGAEGGMLWLPHSVGVELSMAPAPGGGKRGRRELHVAAVWSPQPGMVLAVRRRYGPDGALVEASSSTAVRAT